MNPSTARPRRVELERQGLIARTSGVAFTASGRRATLWVSPMTRVSPASPTEPIELRTTTVVWDGVYLQHTYMPRFPESAKCAQEWLQGVVTRAVVTANPATLIQVKVDTGPFDPHSVEP